MRKFFTLLTMCMLASMAWAGVITFDPEVDKGTAGETASAYDVLKENVNIHVSNGLVAADKGVWAYRVYKGQTMTISCEDAAILKVEFECTANGTEKYGPGCFTADLPSYTYEESGPNGTWTGSSNSVVFTASANQVRATKIIVTTGEAGLVPPVISPAGGKFYIPLQVSITCPTPNAQIYYTTNGSAPSTSSTRYTAPFTVSDNTTVKAISVLDSEKSEVVTAEFTKGTGATLVANIAEYKAVPDETLVAFTNPVTVLTQSGSRMFVQDGTGNALFFGNAGQNYTKGDIIPAGFAGIKTTWDGEPELKELECFAAPTSNVHVDSLQITCNQVAANLFGKYVYLKNVTFDKSSKKVIDASGEAPYYCNMNVSEDQLLAGHTFNLWAIVGSYGNQNTTYQLLPIKLEDLGGEEPPVPGIALCELGDVADGTKVTIKNDAIVLGQVGQYLYLKDTECGFGLAFGQCGKSYKAGDVIPAGFGGEKSTYDMEPELKNLTGFQAAKSNIGGAAALEAAARLTRISEVGHSIWGEYVKIENIFIDTDAKTFRDADGNVIGYYDRFGIQFPSDLSKPYTLYAIVGSFMTNYQLLPTRIDFREPPVEVACIEELYAKNQGTVGHFTTPLTTVYQNGPRLYVRDYDDHFSLVYGSVAYTEFENGDYINGAEASWTLYLNNKQLTPVAETFVPAGHGEPVEPEYVSIEEISPDMIHRYFAFEVVTIECVENNGRKNYTMYDETGSMILYDQFHVLENIQNFDNEFYVEGFLTVYNGTLELYPTKVEPIGSDCGLKGDVNGDGEVNIGDINALIDVILSGGSLDTCSMWRADLAEDGELSLADINALIDYVLMH